jgi:hypothetical protein
MIVTKSKKVITIMFLFACQSSLLICEEFTNDSLKELTTRQIHEKIEKLEQENQKIKKEIEKQKERQKKLFEYLSNISQKTQKSD